ncbi:hypothetical protein CERSUDRAFT_88672, partial [Gelatoporia subvermispora B]
MLARTLQEEENIALLDYLPLTEDKEDESTARSSRRQGCTSLISVNWLIALLVFIVATDVFAFIKTSHMFRTVYPDRFLEDSRLEIANPYVGLEDLYRSGKANASRIEPILNTPRVITQVYRDRPDGPAPIGEHDFLNQYGTLAPNEKHLHVDPATHTIAQFRTVDFGMEECSLIFRLPRVDEPLEGKDPFMMEASSVFAVYRLDVAEPLDVRTLSWRTHPARSSKVGALSPKAGEETEVARFPCEWASLHTFEVACAIGSQCLLDVWSSQNRTWGLYMYQHQTV